MSLEDFVVVGEEDVIFDYSRVAYCLVESSDLDRSERFYAGDHKDILYISKDVPAEYRGIVAYGLLVNKKQRGQLTPLEQIHAELIVVPEGKLEGYLGVRRKIVADRLVELAKDGKVNGLIDQFMIADKYLESLIRTVEGRQERVYSVNSLGKQNPNELPD